MYCIYFSEKTTELFGHSVLTVLTVQQDVGEVEGSYDVTAGMFKVRLTV